MTLQNVKRGVPPRGKREAKRGEGEAGPTFSAKTKKKQPRQYAQMCYLGCQEMPDAVDVCRLLEPLVRSAGAWKAWGVLADLPQSSELLEGFRKAGFTSWARQNIYQLIPNEKDRNEETIQWRLWNSQDIDFMNNLFKEVVPGAVQTIEPMTRKAALGLVAYQSDGSLAGYADLEYGPKGIWAQVISSPNVRAAGLLIDLPGAVPELAGRPVFLCVRSYQSWLDAAVEEAGFSKSEAQVLLVKHLVLRKSLDRSVVKQMLEGSTMEGSLPITQLK